MISDCGLGNKAEICFLFDTLFNHFDTYVYVFYPPNVITFKILNPLS